VIGGFLGGPANGTGGFSHSEDALPEQGAPRLNAGFGEEPCEEAHFGRGVVLPDKGTGRGDHAAPGPQPVEGSSIQRSIFLLAPGQDPFVGG
jgi:hypothetical protein